MTFVSEVDSFFSKLLAFVGSLCLSGIVFIIILNIILRFIFRAPIMWSIEGCSILVVWMTFIVFGMNHREHLHFRITAITGLFNPHAQRIINVIVDFLTLACLIILFYSSIEAARTNGSMPMMTINIPIFYAFYLPMISGIITYIFWIFFTIKHTAKAVI